MSLKDIVKALTRGAPQTPHLRACARYRARNLEACRARVRASKRKAKQRAGA